MKRLQKTFLITILLIGSIIQVPITCSHMIISSNYPLDPDDDRILQAVDFLYSHQDETGKIKGFSISSWAAMALSLIDKNDSRFLKLSHYITSSTHLIDFEKATDIERHILALVACDINPEKVNSMNLTEKLIELYDGVQIGDPVNIYDDIFGVIALISTGHSPESQIISQLKDTILSKQDEDGSWGDVDTTSVAIMALCCAGLTNQSPVFEKAVNYLKLKQSQSGGFTSWGSVNIASTCWALSALTKLDIDPRSVDWMQNTSSPITFLLSLQQLDGSFNYTISQSINSEWMTTYAIIALCGSSFPVKIQEKSNTIDPDSSDDETNDNHDSSQNSEQDFEYLDPMIETNYEEIHILHPHRQGIYFMNKKTQLYFDSLIVIGPIDLTIGVTESVDKVIFYLNDICIGEDTHPPYSISFDQKASPLMNTIIVQAIKYNQSFYQINSDYYIPQIVDNMTKYLCNWNKKCYQNLSEMIFKMDQLHIDKIYQTEMSLIVMSMPLLSKTLVY